MFEMMVPARWSALRRQMDQLFDHYLPDGGGSPPAYPSTNIWEDSNTVFAEAEMPGVKIEDVDISVSGDQLTIRGERKTEEKDGMTCHRRERPSGTFARVIRLPASIDSNKVQAEFRNGILTITLPKSEHARPRRIEVKKTS